ncbi:hypothetical protein LY78DRAFT_380687 [Colletotrichum sublineola]|nr:hypothetical protein LY78DRAFT_380687 [Colletotrichum sublineola]
MPRWNRASLLGTCLLPTYVTHCCAFVPTQVPRQGSGLSQAERKTLVPLEMTKRRRVEKREGMTLLPATDVQRSSFRPVQRFIWNPIGPSAAATAATVRDLHPSVRSRQRNRTSTRVVF